MNVPGKYQEILGEPWVVESVHGCCSDSGWCYVTTRKTLEEAVEFCESWNWDGYRIYNNKTGEVLDAPPLTEEK